jgi:hypothetical protein
MKELDDLVSAFGSPPSNGFDTERQLEEEEDSGLVIYHGPVGDKYRCGGLIRILT